MVNKQIIDHYVKAEEYWMAARNILEKVMPVAQEPKLMVRALECLQKSIGNLINCILKYEYIYGKGKMYKDSERNLDLFFREYAKKAGLSGGNRKKLMRLVFLSRKHREVGFEFSKNGKVFMLDDELKLFEIDKKGILEFLELERNMLNSVKVKYFGSIGF
jgi:hypothetical protein